MTSLLLSLKYRQFEDRPPQADHGMNFIQPATAVRNLLQSRSMPNVCLHPRVQVVSRDEDSEFVECLECREVFDSSEFRDMDIEAKIPTEDEE